jgi:hypothetical protein
MKLLDEMKRRGSEENTSRDELLTKCTDRSGEIQEILVGVWVGERGTASQATEKKRRTTSQPRRGSGWGGSGDVWRLWERRYTFCGALVRGATHYCHVGWRRLERHEGHDV